MAWQFRGHSPVYRQIVRHIRADILNGCYQPDEQIPPVRQLAMEAGVNPNTMQRALQKQIAAGIAGQAELGEHGQLYAAGCSFVQSIRDLPDIIGAVGHPQCGRKGGCFQKTIFHRRISHPVFLS